MRILQKFFFAKKSSPYVLQSTRTLIVKNYFLFSLSLEENCEISCLIFLKCKKFFSKSVKTLRILKILRPHNHTTLIKFCRAISKKFQLLSSIYLMIAPESRQYIKTSTTIFSALESLMKPHRVKSLEKMNIAFTDNIIFPLFEKVVLNSIASQRKLKKYQLNLVSLMRPYHSRKPVVLQFFKTFSRLHNLENLSFETSWLKNSSLARAIGPLIVKISKLKSLEFNGVISDEDNKNSDIIQVLSNYIGKIGNTLENLSINFFNYIADENYDSTIKSLNKLLYSLGSVIDLKIKIHFHVSKSAIQSFLSSLGLLENLKRLNFSILQRLLQEEVLDSLSLGLEDLKKLEKLKVSFFADHVKNPRQDQEISKFGESLSKLERLQCLNLSFSQYSIMNFEHFFSKLKPFSCLKTFKFHGNFKKISKVDSLFQFVLGLTHLEDLRLWVNTNEFISKHSLAGIKNLVNEKFNLIGLSLNFGDCSRKDLYTSHILDKMKDLKKLKLKGVFISTEEWINFINTIKLLESLHKLIIMGTFERDFDVISLESLASFKSRVYVRITVIKMGSMPYMYELDQLSTGLI